MSQASIFLKFSAILDSGASLHVFNDLSRFSNFRKAVCGDYLLAGASEVPILGYGHVHLRITKENGAKGILRLKDVAFCPDFVTNIVSFRLLRAKGIHWNTISNTLFRESDSSLVCTLKEIMGQQVIEDNSEQLTASALAINRIRRQRKATSRQPRPASKGDGALWHARMGHPGPMSLHKLGANSLGVILRGPSTTECEFCSQAKIRRQISRRPPDRKVTKPCQEIHIDWTDLETAYEGFVRIMFITDRYSGMVFPYFMSTHGEEKENLRVLKDFVNWMNKRFSLKAQVIRSDNELGRKKTLRWLRSQGIEFEPSAPRTQDQNGVAERSGGVIMEKSRAMRISANLPHDLWKEVVNCAVYLHNRSPRELQAWKTPYEVFFSYIEANQGTQGIQKKPQLAHLKAYGCRTYAMTEDAQLKRNKKRKLDPRAYIGYLVGYDSTNIFRIWIPHKGQVISTRDVLFDEKTFFDGKLEAPRQMIAEMDSLVARVRLPEAEATNERILEEDEEVLESLHDPENEESDESVVGFDEKEDYELARALQEALLTPPPSEVDPDAAFHVQLPVGLTAQAQEQSLCEACSQGVAEDERFEDFIDIKISSAFHGAFVAGRKLKKIHKRNLPPAPKTIRDLKGHPYEKEFRQAQLDHLDSHRQMQSFYEVDKKHAKGQRVIHSMWVFIYKTDKHGFLQKCKARLVICGNQQAPGDLPTRATTLASMAFRALMAIVAKFDLEAIQMDAVNAFVNCHLDEVVYMKQPPGFETGKVLRLRKALYGLRRSPLLWQKALTSTFRELGYKEVPQEPCVMINKGMIVFFFVDDIVVCYRKKDEAKAKATVAGLEAKYKMSILGSLKWFLGVHILRDRAKKTLWLSQEAYVDKLANQFEVDLTGRLPDTPMTTEELLPSEETASKASIHLYQRKTGSILFAAITTRPDVAFAASRLARFNNNPGEEHHKAADRAIQYLYATKGKALRYDSDDEGARSFICASDASFADNTMDRKSSQGYIMLLFGGPIAWKANKQNTVTTSSTEAELLALSQTAKEAIFVSRLLKALMLELDKPLVIECDNTQTLRLVTEESMKLATKLRHVDIHNHWLRQEHAEKRVLFQWTATKNMMADGLTKALPRQRHEEFIRLIRLDDITERLQQEKKMEDLRDRIIEARAGRSKETVLLVHTGMKRREIAGLGLKNSWTDFEVKTP